MDEDRDYVALNISKVSPPVYGLGRLVNQERSFQVMLVRFPTPESLLISTSRTSFSL